MRLQTLQILGLMLAGTGAVSAAPVTYASEAAFDAANPGAIGYSFESEPGDIDAGTTYGKAPLTVSGSSLTLFNDGAYGWNISYLDTSGGGTFTIAGAALGLFLGSYYGPQTVTYSIDGKTGTFDVSGSPNSSFFGVSDSGPVSLTLASDGELDVVGFKAVAATAVVAPAASGPAATAPVPETGTWAMMITGLGIAGATVRRKRARGMLQAGLAE